MSSTVEVIQPSGLFDGAKAKQLRRHVSDIMTTGVDVVLIDLQDITFIDSSGLGGLISAQRIVQTANSQLFLCSVNNQAKMLFELTKMNQIFKIFVDREEFNSTVFGTEVDNMRQLCSSSHTT